MRPRRRNYISVMFGPLSQSSFYTPPCPSSNVRDCKCAKLGTKASPSVRGSDWVKCLNFQALSLWIGRKCSGTVSFHNFKSQKFKLSVSNPKKISVVYLSVLSQISNCQSLGLKNNFEMLKTYRTTQHTQLTRPPKGHRRLWRVPHRRLARVRPADGQGHNDKQTQW